MTYAAFRTSDTIYRARPPANRRTARWAWDYLAAKNPTPIKLLRLLGGYWGVLREDDSGPDEIEADWVLQRLRAGDAPIPGEARP